MTSQSLRVGLEAAVNVAMMESDWPPAMFTLWVPEAVDHSTAAAWVRVAAQANPIANNVFLMVCPSVSRRVKNRIGEILSTFTHPRQ